jgi:aspartate 1-decarboxylase
MLKSKIHRAVVTGADLNYQGSISVDQHLLELANIYPYEKVAVLDVENGNRFETYAIKGKPGEVCLNGAAARMVQPGDHVIILTYCQIDGLSDEIEDWQPIVVFVDEKNNPIIR